jgi:hypothetical protein
MKRKARNAGTPPLWAVLPVILCLWALTLPPALPVYASEENTVVPEGHLPPAYEFNLGGDAILTSNIPNGMITNGPVVLQFPTGEVSIQRNGIPFPYIPGTAIEMGGEYTLFVVVAYQWVETFRFRVVTIPVNDLVEFAAPEGFVLTEVLHNGIPQVIADPHVFLITDDGDYQVTFAGGDSVHTAQVTVDRETPRLVFMRMLGDGRMEEIFVSPEGDSAFEAPVTFTPMGDRAYTLQVVFNRAAINPAPTTLTEPGRYHITVTDAAGNQAVYTFRILYIMDVPTVWIIVIASLLIAALGIYLVHNRMTVRVR